ncbi:MAG: hypothetical protein J6C46_01495 [Clostridia bacterium]|nr:hypothetical protein [Clostridia bacterium]
MNKSRLSITMLITIIIILIGSIVFYLKFCEENSAMNSNIDLDKNFENDLHKYSDFKIEKIVLPKMYTYIESDSSKNPVSFDITVEYSTDNYIEIIFNSEINNKDDVKVFLLQTGSYVHLKKVNEENEKYRIDHLYEISGNKIKIIQNDFHGILPGGFLKININNANSHNMNFYCTTTMFNDVTLLCDRLNMTNEKRHSMILQKTNKDNKKIAYITENTELLDENGEVICNLYFGDNVEIINEETRLCTIYYPNTENINKIKTINDNIDIYNSQYVDKFSGYIKKDTFKIIPEPKNDNSIVEVYIESTGFETVPVISVCSPFMGYNQIEITKDVEITSKLVSNLEDELLIQNKVFMLPTSYWSGYTINGENLENLDPRSQPYILNLSNEEYQDVKNSIIEYYNFLEAKWNNTVVSLENLNHKENTIKRAKKYIDFELCFLDWIAIDRMNDLNKFADRVYEKIGTSETRERMYYLLTNLDKDYSNNMMMFINEFLAGVI